MTSNSDFQPIGRGLRQTLDSLRGQIDAMEATAGHVAPDYTSPEYQNGLAAKWRLEKTGIPDRYLRRTLDGFQATSPKGRKLLERVRRFAREALTIDGLDGPSGLLLYGPAGTGKSHLACAALAELIKAGAQGLYISPADWFTRIRRTYNRDLDEETEEDLLDETGAAGVLLIDDLGVGKEGQEWQAEKLYQLINRRVNNGRPTIVTTNHRFPDDLALYVGERVTSRLFEICTILSTTDLPDWRDQRNRTK